MTLKIRDLLECEIPCGHPEPPAIVEATLGMTLQRPPYDPPAGATLKSAGKKQGRRVGIKSRGESSKWSSIVGNCHQRLQQRCSDREELEPKEPKLADLLNIKP